MLFLSFADRFSGVINIRNLVYDPNSYDTPKFGEGIYRDFDQPDIINFNKNARFRYPTDWIFVSKKVLSYNFAITANVKLLDKEEHFSEEQHSFLFAMRGVTDGLVIPALRTRHRASVVPIQFAVVFKAYNPNTRTRKVELFLPRLRPNSAQEISERVTMTLKGMDWNWHNLAFKVSNESSGAKLIAFVDCNQVDEVRLPPGIDVRAPFPLDMHDELFLAWSGDVKKPHALPVSDFNICLLNSIKV